METPQDTSLQPITISTLVNAPVGRVWECFTGPEHIVHWNTAHESWHSPRAENDLRTGGKFEFRMEAKDGSVGFDFVGVYDEVTNHKTIAYTMTDGRKVDVRFEQENNATKVTETFDPESSNPLEMQRSGWQAILDNFKAYVERVENDK